MSLLRSTLSLSHSLVSILFCGRCEWNGRLVANIFPKYLKLLNDRIYWVVLSAPNGPCVRGLCCASLKIICAMRSPALARARSTLNRQFIASDNLFAAQKESIGLLFFFFFYVYHCGQTVVTTAQQENREKIKNNNNNHKKCTNVLIRIWPARCVKFSIPKHFLHCSSVVLWFLRGFQLVCPLTFSLVTFVVRRRSVERKMYADSPVDTSHSSVNEVNNSNLTHFQRTLFACRLSFGSLCGEFSGDDRAKNWDVAVACKEFERRPQTNILCIWICCFFISVHFIERVRDTFTLRINAFELAQRHKFQFYCFLTTYIHTSYMPPQHLKMHYEKLR